MTITLANRDSFTLDHFIAVAWQGQGVNLETSALEYIDYCRSGFLRLLDDPAITVYGVTSGYGQMASVRLSVEERREHAAQAPFASMAGFGGDLPERVKRGIVFARLTNFIEGHAAVRADLVSAVAALLDSPLPRVPAQGNASAGEIIPLSHLFTTLWQEQELAEKEALALINGSPCASTLVADAAVSALARIELALDVFALSAEALAAPHEHYAEVLDTLHRNPMLSEIQSQLRARMNGPGGDRRPYQAPVSWRITPGVLAHAAAAQQRLGQLADDALKTITDNPVYIPPDSLHPDGQVLSTGGYHNAEASAAINAVSGAFADLAVLCDRQISKLFDGNVSGLPPRLAAGSGYAGCIGFIAADFAQQASLHAQRTVLPGSEGGGFGQNDVVSPVFQAWRGYEDTGRCLDACLAILAVTASQAYHVTGADCPAPLQALLDEVRFWVPPLVTPRAMGLSIGDVAERFTERVYRQSIFDQSSGHVGDA